MGCNCCPYGPLVTFPAIFSWCAVGLSWALAFGCRFFYSDYFGRTRGYGIWTLQQGQFDGIGFNDDHMTVYADTICVTYEFDNYFQNSSSTTAAQFLDVPMKFSRSMATITYVVSVPAAIAILFLACVEMGRCGFYTLGGICIFQGVVAILSLVVLATELCTGAPSCSFGGTGVTAIIATVFWWLTAAFILLIPKEPRGRSGPPSAAAPMAMPAGGQPTSTVTITRTANPDGTTTVLTTTTTTHPDGSKTVTEQTDIEQPESGVEPEIKIPTDTAMTGM